MSVYVSMERRDGPAVDHNSARCLLRSAKPEHYDPVVEAKSVLNRKRTVITSSAFRLVLPSGDGDLTALFPT
jgi:hypothetical protein